MPRGLAVQESPRFAEYLKAITDLFRARGVLRYRCRSDLRRRPAVGSARTAG